MLRGRSLRGRDDLQQQRLPVSGAGRMLIDRSFSELLVSDGGATDPTERRATPRIGLAVDVLIGAAGRLTCGVSCDVSMGGLGMWTYRPVARGTRVSVRFRLPTGSVTGTCVVQWLRGQRPGRLPRIGLEFVQLELADITVLRHFCAARPRMLTHQEVLDMVRAH